MPKGEKNKKTDEEIEIDVYNLGYKILNKYSRVSKKVIIEDKSGYKYDIFLGNILKGQNINFVDTRNPFSLENISLWLKLNKKEFILNKNNKYVNSKSVLSFHCLKEICDSDFICSWDNVFANRGCAVCAGRQIGKYNSLAYLRPDLVLEWDYDKNKIIPSDVTVSSDVYAFWICQKCEYRWYAAIKDRNMGNGCPGCSGHALTDKNRLSIKFPEISAQWHPTKNGKITPHDVSFGSPDKFWWICKKGHEYFSAISKRTNGRGCPKCKQSDGEERIEKFLTSYNIDNKSEYFGFKDCKDKGILPFDFYLHDYNICIEYNGEQHYFVLRNKFFGGEKELKERQRRDKIKKEYCEKNKIKLIIIPYWDFNQIEKILKTEIK